MQSGSTPRVRNTRKTRMIVGIAVIVVAVGVLLWLGLGRGAVYYYSVSELIEVGSAQNVRVSGELEGGSLVDADGSRSTFTIYDRDSTSDRITVVYESALPDTFKDEPGAEVVAEGDYYGNSTFVAETLITKCPSKYEAAK
jgi:cytochrome c-type biogenesis protein CcmE